tara:strand:- start:303 stop:1211 length:909 start_codon:yes stop_codon:yes gene_type:complete
MKKNDDMSGFYLKNPKHYQNSLQRIGCNEEQIINYNIVFNSFRKKYLEYVESIINSNQVHTILDLGCGTCDDLIYLSKLFPNKKFYGLELNIEYVKILQTKFQNSNIYIINSFDDLNCKFDLILSNCVYEHVGNIDAFTKDWSNVLNKNAAYVHVVPNDRYWYYWLNIFYIIKLIMFKRPETHSVRRKFMMRVLNKYLRNDELHVNVYGYRPPQNLYTILNSRDLKIISQRHEQFECFINKLGLKRLNYLEIYYGKKGDFKLNSFINKNIILSCKDYFFIPYNLIKHLLYMFFLTIKLIIKK